MKIADFFAQIGFKVDTKSLQNFNDGMTTVVNTVRGLALGLTSAMTAWELMQVKIGKSAQSMLNFKKYTGENIEEIRKLATVMQSVNLNFSMETLLSDVQSFKEEIRRGQLFGEGGGIMQTLRILGVTGLKKGGIQTIEDFLNALRQVPDEATRTMLLHQAHLSDQWLNILDLPKAQFEQLFQQNKDMFPDAAELKRRQEATIAIYIEWKKLVNLFETKITDFAPTLLKILEKIREIVSDSDKLNKIVEGIKWFFIISGITMVSNALIGVIRGLKSILWLVPLVLGALRGMGRGVSSFIWNSSLTQGALNAMTRPTVRGVGLSAISGGTAVAAGGVAGAAGAKGLSKLLGKQAAKAVGGRLAAAGAAQAAPMIGQVVGLGLLAWTAYDLIKLAGQLAQANNNDVPSENKLNNSNSLTDNNETYNWNKNLSNMFVNAQNVYINANRMFGGGSESSFVENNVARSIYNMEVW